VDLRQQWAANAQEVRHARRRFVAASVAAIVAATGVAACTNNSPKVYATADSTLLRAVKRYEKAESYAFHDRRTFSDFEGAPPPTQTFDGVVERPNRADWTLRQAGDPVGDHLRLIDRTSYKLVDDVWHVELVGAAPLTTTSLFAEMRRARWEQTTGGLHAERTSIGSHGVVEHVDYTVSGTVDRLRIRTRSDYDKRNTLVSDATFSDVNGGQTVPDPEPLDPTPPRSSLSRSSATTAGEGHAGAVEHGTVAFWHDEEGWGAIQTPDREGVGFVLFADVRVPGYRTLVPGERVDFEWLDDFHQDGCQWRVAWVKPSWRFGRG
jgi:CspA family cold shock protein